MLRWLGAGLILCGGLLARQTLLENGRRTQRARRALAAAFEAMEEEIRLLLTPMPELLRRPYGEETDAFFGQASGSLMRGTSLATAWREAADVLSLPPDEREQVVALGMRLGGSEESVCAALSFAASMLRRRYDETEAARPQKERLTTSICISISLFLTIIFF